MPSKTAIIKKYANRRLYNTQTSCYITLKDLAVMIKSGEDFKVLDAKSNKDLTRQILAQIILEEETSDNALMPTKFLRQLIQFYDDSLQSVLPHYLENSLDNFSENRDQFQEQADTMMDSLATIPGMKEINEIQKQNMEVFQKSLKNFNPFSMTTGGTTDDNNSEEQTKEILRLRHEIKSLKDKITKLKAKK